MSGQYPSGYQSPSGHRGNFNSPMMQQQLGGGAGGVPSQMGEFQNDSFDSGMDLMARFFVCRI